MGDANRLEPSPPAAAGSAAASTDEPAGPALGERDTAAAGLAPTTVLTTAGPGMPSSTGDRLTTGRAPLLSAPPILAAGSCSTCMPAMLLLVDGREPMGGECDAPVREERPDTRLAASTSGSASACSSAALLAERERTATPPPAWLLLPSPRLNPGRATAVVAPPPTKNGELVDVALLDDAAADDPGATGPITGERDTLVGANRDATGSDAEGPMCFGGWDGGEVPGTSGGEELRSGR